MGGDIAAARVLAGVEVLLKEVASTALQACRRPIEYIYVCE